MRKRENLNQLSHSQNEDTASHNSMRRCIVTGTSYPREVLLRFAVSPDGMLVFDVKRNLPGRGAWVYPKAEYVRQATEKNLFSRAAKQQVNIAEDLVEKVQNSLKQRMLNLLQRGLQSREMIHGFEKVSSALRAQETRLLIHASDASEDGVSKLNKLAEEKVTILQPLARDELSGVLQIANPVHLSVKSTGLAQSFIAVHKVWAGFLDKDTL